MRKEKHVVQPRMEGIDLLAIFLVLLKYRKFISIVSFLAVAGILAFMIFSAIVPPEASPFPDTYRASAVISLNQRVYSDVLTSVFSPGISNVSATEQGQSLLGFNYGEYVMRLLRSKSVTDVIAAEFDVAGRYHTDGRFSGRVRAQILNRLFLSYDEKTLMITISYEDVDPEFAAHMTNRLVEILGERILYLKESRSSYQKDLLKKKLDELQAGLDELETKIKDFQAKYGVIEVDKLSDEKIALLANLRSQLVLKEVELRSYETSSQIEDPSLIKLRSERETLRQLIAEIETGNSGLQNGLPSQTLLSEIVLEYSHLERDYRIQEKIYETLLLEFEITKIRLSLVGEEPTFQVIETAEVPDTKWGPARTLWTVTLSVAAFILCCIVVLIYNALRERDLIRKIRFGGLLK